MRVAAIDLGAVRVGLALSDELGWMAHPRPPLDGRKKDALLVRLAELAKEECLGRFLVGLPVRLDGREGPEARRARAFATALQASTGLPVEMLDERWTTREAASRLRAGGTRSKEGRGRIDGAAAAIMLQSWLDAHRETDGHST
jgi:putative Holliday junction resolvase